MPRPALDQIERLYREQQQGGIEGELSLNLAVGRLVKAAERDRRFRERCAAEVNIFPIPPQVWPVVNGAPVPPTYVADAMAPKDGYIWFPVRISVDGLVAGGGAATAIEGTVVTPGGNSVIANIPSTSIVPGSYSVAWQVQLAGTPGAGDANNFQLKYPTTTALLVSENQGAVGGPWPQETYAPLVIPAGNASAVGVRSVNAGTAGAIYTAQLALTPLADDQVTLYRGIAAAITAQPQNRLRSFSALGGAPGPDWSPGSHGCPMNHQDAFVLSGANLAASQLVLSADVISMPLDMVGAYIVND